MPKRSGAEQFHPGRIDEGPLSDFLPNYMTTAYEWSD
jgi:hypothetical protein